MAGIGDLLSAARGATGRRSAFGFESRSAARRRGEEDRESARRRGEEKRAREDRDKDRAERSSSRKRDTFFRNLTNFRSNSGFNGGRRSRSGRDTGELNPSFKSGTNRGLADNLRELQLLRAIGEAQESVPEFTPEETRQNRAGELQISALERRERAAQQLEDLGKGSVFRPPGISNIFQPNTVSDAQQAFLRNQLGFPSFGGSSNTRQQPTAFSLSRDRADVRRRNRRPDRRGRPSSRSGGTSFFDQRSFLDQILGQ